MNYMPSSDAGETYGPISLRKVEISGESRLGLGGKNKGVHHRCEIGHYSILFYLYKMLIRAPVFQCQPQAMQALESRRLYKNPSGSGTAT